MFRPTAPTSRIGSTFALLELIFHASVRHVRKSNGNAIVGLLVSIAQSLVGIGVMLLMFNLIGRSVGTQVRGDFILYIMSGIFSFMTHAKAIKAVSGAEGPTSSMMKHAPMNTIVSVSAAALSALYMQTLSAAVILFGYHALWTPISIDEPVGVAAMYLLSWSSGIGIGLIFKAITPWAPDFFSVATTAYTRANFVFSGKMFVANMTSMYILSVFMWNPLFHCIDQTRGYMFLNYEPRYTSALYPVITTFVLLVIGLMMERYTEKHISASWNAKR
ncbi:ABC transporter permease [Tabrizicola oligotrophica]|uniref:ABC transporter permease n=1 Tax=Tabrizicola oligotrophica TaxID=2710650 RepID=A0A6M0QT55_9RHOB|nr:ABC transporter permease [Tabrizicola oligotrophica]NEY90024.1 ABC transporter permease [Tabrizicola oligotrophica]